jgi:hypothetical protein
VREYEATIQVKPTTLETLRAERKREREEIANAAKCLLIMVVAFYLGFVCGREWS